MQAYSSGEIKWLMQRFGIPVLCDLRGTSMEIVTIRIPDKKPSAKALVAMSGRGRVDCYDDDVYVVPEAALELLTGIGITYQELGRTSKWKMTDPVTIAPEIFRLPREVAEGAMVHTTWPTAPERLRRCSHSCLERMARSGEQMGRLVWPMAGICAGVH